MNPDTLPTSSYGQYAYLYIRLPSHSPLPTPIHVFHTPTSPVRYEGAKRFSYASLGYVAHEPTTRRLRTLDKELTSFIRDFFEKGGEEKRFLYVLGDHGVGFGDYYSKSYHAKNHYKRPALFAVASAALLDAFPEIGAGMAAAEGSVTTPFDAYVEKRESERESVCVGGGGVCV
jgi:hypothetical protein